MCGITGAIWNDQKQEISQSQLAAMTDVLAHRGPDDRGTYENQLCHLSGYGDMPGVGLGFRRLSIIDLEGGHQPICNEDRTIWLVFNGEIYNHVELRRLLEASGHRFRSCCDSEVIVHLYEEHGEDCFAKLNGMFAIAIWDRNRRKLLLARDRLGQKPLVYALQSGRLAFASELKSLLQVPGINRELDPNAIDEFLTYQYVPHPNTIYRDLKKLMPGHLAVWQDGVFKTRAYWQVPTSGQEDDTGPGGTVSKLRELLRSAVEMRMQADVPLGAFLSGGVDSSLIVALMQEASEQPIKTFSIGFPVKEYNESSYARQVAQHLGTDHHEFEVTPDAVGILPQLVEQYDEPFADSSAIPTWYVSQMTREHVTVALSGDGGDELFAGYPRYRAVKLGSYLDRLGPLRSLLAASFWQRLPGTAKHKGIVRRFKRFTEPLPLSPLRRYLEWIAIFNETARARLYRDSFVEQLNESDPFQFLKQFGDRCEHRDIVTQVSLVDLQTYLPCDLMTKVDTASMAHSLEVRQPFLDWRLVEFAAGLPIGLKLKGMKGKRLLRTAFEARLPEEIWDRPKMGFGVPLDHWFRNELRDTTRELLFANDACLRDYFQQAEIESLFQAHQSRKLDHSYRLWALLVFELWLRRWTKSRDDATVKSPIQVQIS